MLRDFEYNPGISQLSDILERFGFDLITEKYPFDILRFEVITPDSFMWKLHISNGIYYLYAEDYIISFDYIKSVFNSYLESSDWEFINPDNTILFESATPVKHAKVYRKPEDADEMMKYAVDSGHDFVFMVKSSEDVNIARFSKNTPRGFKP